MIINELISPSKLFKNLKEVNDFINIPCKKIDLECFLKICEEEELYEYCIIIKEKIKQSYG